MQYLFIGGPVDGKRLETDGNPEYHIPLPASKAQFVLHAGLPIPAPVEVFTYVRKSITTSKGQFPFYCPRFWTIEDAVGAVLQAYHGMHE